MQPVLPWWLTSQHSVDDFGVNAVSMTVLVHKKKQYLGSGNPNNTHDF